MTDNDWVLGRGSGSLRRALEEGMAWRSMYVHERLAFELCSAAELVPRSRVAVGVALAAPDDPATTEACWYARALRWRFSKSPVHEGIQISVRHLRVVDVGGESREGMGLVFTGLSHASWDWLPSREVVFAFVEVNGVVQNPC